MKGVSFSGPVIHCAPQIPNYDDKRQIRLKAGQVIAIEPFATTGKGYIEEVGKSEVFMASRDPKPKDRLPQKLVDALEDFHRLPFSRRDLKRFMSTKEVEQAITTMRKRRLIKDFPPLAEKPGTRISQHEHTVMITESGSEVTTRIM